MKWRRDESEFRASEIPRLKGDLYLDRDLVNFVEDVDAWNVDAVSLHHVNQIFRRRVHSKAVKNDYDNFPNLHQNSYFPGIAKTLFTSRQPKDNFAH